MFYKTQIEKLGAGFAVDSFGRRLTFIGNYPCNVGDFVWTDGNVVFGNISNKSQPVILDDDVSGIPVVFVANNDVQRGYFTNSLAFKKFNVVANNFFVNNSKFFFHDLPNFSDTNNIFDEDISDNGKLFSLLTERNGVANHLLAQLLPIHIYLDNSLVNSFNIDVNDIISDDVKQIFDASKNDFRFISDAPPDFEYNNFLTQLLLGKIYSDGQYQLIFGTYVSADFCLPKTSPAYNGVPAFDSKIKFTPDEGNFVFDFQGTCNINDDFSWVKSKYNEDNLYLDSNISESERPYYSALRKFRKEHDKYLIPAIMALFNIALESPVSNFEVEAYHLDENYPVPDYVPNIQSERFWACDSDNNLTRLFYHNTVKYPIETNQGGINSADRYTANPSSLNSQDPNLPLHFNINPAGLVRILSDTQRQVIPIPTDRFTVEQAARPIGIAVIMYDFDNSGAFPHLQGKSGAVYHYVHNDKPVMPDGAVLTYKVYPLVANSICGIAYVVYASWISAPFQNVFSPVDSTIHISFKATDLFQNNWTFNNWIVNSDYFFYSYVDYSLNPYIDVNVGKNLVMPYGVFHGDNWSLRSHFAIRADYDYKVDIPNGGRWQPLENISMLDLNNGNYLLGFHSDKLFSFNDNFQILCLGDKLKNFRLNSLLKMSKARR